MTNNDVRSKLRKRLTAVAVAVSMLLLGCGCRQRGTRTGDRGCRAAGRRRRQPRAPFRPCPPPHP